MGEVRTGVPVSIHISLEQDGTDGELGCVSGNCKRSRKVRHLEDRFREEEGFQGVKCDLTFQGTVSCEVLFGEVNEGAATVE